MAMKTSSRAYAAYATLPETVMLDVFSRIPLQDLSECKFVCKAWYNDWRSITNDPFFIKLHHSRLDKDYASYLLCFYLDNFYLMNMNKPQTTPIKAIDSNLDSLMREKHVQLVGSSNGLVCLCSANNRIFYICNPITKEILELPEADYYGTDIGINRTPNGFAYDSTTCTYKVVHTWGYSVKLDGKDVDGVGMQIYTLGSHKWRRLDDMNAYVQTVSNSSQVSLNGTLYWDCTLHCFQSNGSNSIVSMDIETNTFRFLKGLDSMRNETNKTTRILGSLDGQLCLMYAYDNPQEIIIWVMKESVTVSWEKKLVIENMGLQPLLLDRIFPIYSSRILRNANILLEGGEKYDYYYDSEKREYKKITTKEFLRFLGAIDHVGSLVSPNTIVGKQPTLGDGQQN